LGFKGFDSGAGVAFSFPLRDETGGFDEVGAGVDFFLVRATTAGVEGIGFEVDATGAGVGTEGSGTGGLFGVAEDEETNQSNSFETESKNLTYQVCDEKILLEVPICEDQVEI